MGASRSRPLSLLDRFGCASTRSPSELQDGLSRQARKLVQKAFEGIERGALLDYHAHISGLGTGGTGAFVNPRMLSWRHPVQHLKFRVFISGYGVRDLPRADEQAVDRLVDLIRNIGGHGKCAILAFDRHLKPDGTPDLEHTSFHVPNDYVFEVARAHPDCFHPVMSIHPYRPDALEEMDRWAGQGGRILKWLPNAMGMDPADERCIPFYERMRKHQLILLTHVGGEQAVEGEEYQKLGNPLRLRLPLKLGLRVIMAHCASLGSDVDLEDHQHSRPSSFDLFLRMMEEKQYQGRLFGELSATTQFNRQEVLATLLERTEFHARLVNGTDYPLPAINVVIQTRTLRKAGYIAPHERAGLNEIYDFNPLLFDFVLKRTIRHPTLGNRFPASIFTAHPDLALE